MEPQKYPRWIKVEGPGNSQNPGHVLVDNEDQERAVLAGEDAPIELNPTGAKTQEPDEDKALEDLEREELVSILVRESITDDVSDDQLREGIRALRDRQSVDRVNGSVNDDGTEHDHGDMTDAAGDKIAPDPAQEANKGMDLGNNGRRLPDAKAAPATDARPDEAKDKVADDKPAGNVTEAAATPPGHKKGARKPDTDKAD